MSYGNVRVTIYEELADAFSTGRLLDRELEEWRAKLWLPLCKEFVLVVYASMRPHILLYPEKTFVARLDDGTEVGRYVGVPRQ